jgi:hypothetical protein
MPAACCNPIFDPPAAVFGAEQSAGVGHDAPVLESENRPTGPAGFVLVVCLSKSMAARRAGTGKAARCAYLYPKTARGTGARHPKGNAMQRAIPVLIMLASLTGCVSMEELYARDEATCARSGFQPDSTDFNTCVQGQQMLRDYFMARPG